MQIRQYDTVRKTRPEVPEVPSWLVSHPQSGQTGRGTCVPQSEHMYLALRFVKPLFIGCQYAVQQVQFAILPCERLILV